MVSIKCKRVILKVLIGAIVFACLSAIGSYYFVQCMNKYVLKPWEYTPPTKVNKILK